GSRGHVPHAGGARRRERRLPRRGRRETRPDAARWALGEGGARRPHRAGGPAGRAPGVAAGVPVEGDLEGDRGSAPGLESVKREREVAHMPVITRQIGLCFAAEVEGIDMTKPLSAQDVAAIHAGMNKYAVLVFHDQGITDEQQLAFTRSLGELEQTANSSLRGPDEYRLPPTFADVSNLDQNNKIFAREDRRRLFAIGNRLWHSDSSFKVIPAKYSLLHARSIPSKGGNTEFAYMPAAYDALDEETKAQIEDLICKHPKIFSRQQLGFPDFPDEERARFKPVRQRLVRVHQRTGRKSLYLSSHAGTILGWPVPEARFCLRDLVEHATQREFVYAHKWRVGDLVMWDNRQTMHRARPFPAHEPRDMRRTTLAGDGPTAAQAVAAHAPGVRGSH